MYVCVCVCVCMYVACFIDTQVRGKAPESPALTLEVLGDRTEDDEEAELPPLLYHLKK